MAKLESGYEVKAKAFVPVDHTDPQKAHDTLTRLIEIGEEVKKLMGDGSTFEAEFIRRRPKKLGGTSDMAIEEAERNGSPENDDPRQA